MKNWDPIFKTGTHTSSTGVTRKWSAADLDALIKNTGTDVPIVIHHPADQGKAHNFGKIAGLKRVGGELLAQYADVPEILSTAVKEGLRLAKSVSIDPSAMKIRHVGLLGAGQPPAVVGLGAASFAAGDDDHGDDVSLTYMFNHTKKEPAVDPKDLKIKELESQLEAIKADKASEQIKEELAHAEDELKKEKEAHKATKAEFSKYKEELEDKALTSRVDALAESGRIRPAEKDNTLAFARALPDGDKTMEFAAADGKKESVSPRELYLKDMEARSADQDGLLNEFARADHAGRGPGDADDVFKDINSFA